MFASSARRAALSALLLSVVAVACREEVLGPPDAARCTVGTLRAGRVSTGRIDGRSCVVWSDYEYGSSPAESWTLDLAPGTAYIVRLQPVADEDSVNRFVGGLHVYARTAQEDAVFTSGYFNLFGPANSAGGRGQQMILAPGAPRRVSLRVQAISAADTGAYALEVITCPLVLLAPGVTSAAITFDDGCALRVGAASDSQRVAFFGFGANAYDDIQVTAARTAGTALMRLRVGGPDLDFACYTGSCTSSGSAVGAGPLSLLPTFRSDGRFSAMLTQESAGALTATLRVSQAEMLRASSFTNR